MRSCGSVSIFTLQVFACQCLGHRRSSEKEGNLFLRAWLFADTLPHTGVMVLAIPIPPSSLLEGVRHFVLGENN